jgi:signal transduction histidine kinase
VQTVTMGSCGYCMNQREPGTDETLHAGAASLIFGDGEMAERTRTFDWSRSAAGPIASWPDALLLTVNMLLANRQPMFLWWGPQLTQFFNDAYAPSLTEERKRSLLGAGGGPETWPEVWDLIRPEVEQAMRDGVSSWHEDSPIPIRRNGGVEQSYWTYCFSPVRLPAGQIGGVLVTCMETTGRVVADQRARLLMSQLQTSEERTRLALNAANGVGSYDWDIPNDLVYADLGFAAVYGVSPLRAAQGAPIAEFTRNILAEDRSRVEEEIARAMRDGQEFTSEYRLMQEDGSERWVLAKGRCRLAPDGSPLRFSGVTLDITDRKRTEAALLQNEKLAAVGRLAASVAHEINNPLEAVTNLIYLARSQARQREVQEYLDTAELELRRMAMITSQTLRFHKQSTRPMETHMPALIGEMLRTYHARLTNCGVHVERRDRAAQPVRCFESEIRQVLNNLVGNAIDALSAGGRLLLRTRGATDWRSGRSGVAVTISDTGEGMSPEQARRVFQAFFTTKGINGTGLGLWISQEIVDRHQGRLRLRTSLGRGTVFSLFLPFAAATR